MTSDEILKEFKIRMRNRIDSYNEYPARSDFDAGLKVAFERLWDDLECIERINEEKHKKK